MIYLHVGCKWSETWDAEFQRLLNEMGLAYEICDLSSVNPLPHSFFIGRINESCLYLKNQYDQLTSSFVKVWPERLAMRLYDDKFAQSSFLLRYPVPKSIVLSEPCHLDLSLPVVEKKSHGSSSKHVRLVHNFEDLQYPCLVQEYCPNNDRDLRITIVDNHAMAFERMNRKNDFRASGSGQIVSLEEVPVEPARLAWEICREHNFCTMAFDFLKLRGEWVIVEISYTYSLDAIFKYCLNSLNLRTGKTCDPVNPAEIILTRMLQIKQL